MNDIFARKTLDAIALVHDKRMAVPEERRPDPPIIWIHDYHLMVAANAIRLGERKKIISTQPSIWKRTNCFYNFNRLIIFYFRYSKILRAVFSSHCIDHCRSRWSFFFSFIDL